MSLIEAVERQVAAIPGLDRDSVVLFNEIYQALEKLYALLLQPYILFIQFINQTYIQTEAEKLIRVQLTHKQERIVNTLAKEKRVQFGVAGEYQLFFSAQATDGIIITPREHTVYGERLQTNALIDPAFQRAFNVLEQFGEISEVITNKRTGALTLFLASGAECCIYPSDPCFTQIRAILSGEKIRIGGIVSDPLFFFPPIGFYNGNTGEKITELKPPYTACNPAAMESIAYYVDSVQNGTQIKYDPLNPNSTVVVKSTARKRHFAVNDPRNFALQALTQATQPLQVGNCTGSDGIYFIWNFGTLTQRDRREDYVLYREVQANCETTTLLPPGTHLYPDPQKPSVIYLASPGIRLQKCTSNEKHFAALSQLLSGSVGVIHTEEGHGAASYLVFHDTDGITYQLFTNPNEELADSQLIVSTNGSFIFPHISPKKEAALRAERTLENPSKKPKRPTTREKRIKEQRKLPRK